MHFKRFHFTALLQFFPFEFRQNTKTMLKKKKKNMKKQNMFPFNSANIIIALLLFIPKISSSHKIFAWVFFMFSMWFLFVCFSFIRWFFLRLFYIIKKLFTEEWKDSMENAFIICGHWGLVGNKFVKMRFCKMELLPFSIQ